MYDELAVRGFKLYHDAYSNYSNTTSSLTAVFTMEHHFYRISIGNLDALGARDIVGGRLYNPVLSTFKNNGYNTQFVNHSDYIFKKGNALDYAFPTRKIYGVFDVFQIDWLNQLPLMEYLDQTPTGRKVRVSHESHYDQIIQRVSLISKNAASWFTYMHLPLPNHSKGSKDWNELAGFLETYPEQVELANSEILGIVDHVIQNDPSAFVVLMGDHGAVRFRDVWQTGDEQDLHEILSIRQVEEDKLALDLFGILLAIRYPSDHDHRYDNAIMSPVNLFRYVFSVLSDDEELLEAKAEDKSFFRTGYVAVEDGQPLNHWDEIDLRSASSKNARRQIE